MHVVDTQVPGVDTCKLGIWYHEYSQYLRQYYLQVYQWNHYDYTDTRLLFH
jgi:hypothetical protein